MFSIFFFFHNIMNNFNESNVILHIKFFSVYKYYDSFPRNTFFQFESHKLIKLHRESDEIFSYQANFTILVARRTALNFRYTFAPHSRRSILVSGIRICRLSSLAYRCVGVFSLGAARRGNSVASLPTMARYDATNGKFHSKTIVSFGYFLIKETCPFERKNP